MHPTFVNFLKLACLTLLLTLASAPLQATTLAHIEQQLENLAQEDTEEAQKKRELWQKNKDLLQQKTQLAQQLSTLEQAQQSATTDALKLEQQLANSSYIAPDFKHLTLAEQKVALTDAYTQLNALQDELQQAEINFSNTQTLPERNQRRIADTLKLLEDAKAQLATLDSSQQQTPDYIYWQLKTDVHNAELNVLRQELQINPTQQRYANIKQQWVALQIEHAKRSISLREQHLTQQRDAQLDSLLAYGSAEDLQLLAQRSPALAQQIKSNLQYAERLNSVNKAQRTLQQEQLQLQEQLKRSRQMVHNLQEQIDALRGSLLLSQLLYQQQQQLPKPKAPAYDDTQLADWRIEQFQLTKQRIAKTNAVDTAAEMLQQEGTTDSTLQTALADNLEMGWQLLDALSDALADTLDLAVNNRIIYQQLLAAIKQNQDIITEQLFWMPSSRPMDSHWWQQLPQKLFSTLGSLKLQPIYSAFQTGFKKQWPWLLTGFALLALLRRQTSHWQQEVAAINEQTGYVRYERQWHTPKALILSLFNSAPLPLAITLSAILWLPKTTYTYNGMLFTLTWQYGLALWLLLWAKDILHAEGIGQQHFRWSATGSEYFSKRIVPFSLLLLPVLWSIQLGKQHPASLMSNPLGPLLFVIIGLMLAWSLWRPLMQHRETSEAQEKIALLPVIGSLLLLCLPVGVAIASALGYHYTAITLAQRLLLSLAALWACYLIYHLALRALNVSARQLAYERAILRRQYREEKEEVEDSELSAKEDALNLDLVRLNEQSLRLVRWATLLVLGTLLYFIWADLVGALSYLDHITLWSYGESGNATLGNLLGATLILAISIALARNLPSLLAVTVLSRLTLKPGSSYTITALLTYALTSIGIVAAMATLGISWDKLQWLVAALGFGLGFGLQEIFANFISGIILLFERPIRVGDFVTIGNYTGTVTRIRIRATTVRDSNRCEVILPNKAFVTDRFVNWTLTDTVTRVVVKVGFGYDTDLNLAKQMLLDAAAANPRVLDDPAPTALFTAMSASTLDYDLRMHVKTLSDRMRTIDELNQSIIERARALNINIAYNQLEVTLVNTQGDAVTLADDEDSVSSHKNNTLDTKN
ncbi:MAG TPA: mechanosensitive ion channel domain-containing protein [Alcanivoracaceae bacterium]|nr:mechanosensitive ion channel domain-containing protein [Alcanivoracaceae bacterium]